MDDLKARFAYYMRVELGRHESTIAEYLSRIRRLEERFDKPMQDTTSDDLRTLKADPDISRSTIKAYLVTARAWHEWGALEGHWPLGTIAKVRTPQITDIVNRPALSMDKVRALLDACERSLEYRLIYLGLYAGTRIGESAKIAPLNFQDGVLRFRGEKTGAMREIPVHPELEAVLPMLLSPTSANRLSKVKRRIQERVGFHFVPHQLRKTFAATLLEAGVSDEVVKDLLGHTGSVTRLYAPVSPKKRAEAIALLSYGDVLKSEQVSEGAVSATVALTAAPAVRTVGYFSDDIFLYDCLHAVWHQAWWGSDTPRPEVGQVCEQGGRMMLSVCGEMFTEVDDRAGARIFAATPSERMTYCSCIRGRPPEKAAPSRMADLA